MLEQNIEAIKINRNSIGYIQRNIKRWNYPEGKKFPWRNTKSKFHALIAEILLQRTKAEQVIPIYKKFIKTFPTLLSLQELSVNKIKKAIKPLGLGWRAQKIKDLGKTVLKKYSGNIPNTFEELLTLPGVGPYAASAFLSFHNKTRASIIDSNIIRLYGRFWGFKTSSEIRRNKFLIKLSDLITPNKDFKKFNYLLLDLSRSICKIKPLCFQCPILFKCHYFNYERMRNENFI